MSAKKTITRISVAMTTSGITSARTAVVAAFISAATAMLRAVGEAMQNPLVCLDCRTLRPWQHGKTSFILECSLRRSFGLRCPCEAYGQSITFQIAHDLEDVEEKEGGEQGGGGGGGGGGVERRRRRKRFGKCLWKEVLGHNAL